MHVRVWGLLGLLIPLGSSLGCGGGDDAVADASPLDSGGPDTLDAGDASTTPDTASPLPAIPRGADPCGDAEIWTASRASEVHPFIVHFRPGEEALASAIVDAVDAAWTVQVDDLGFRPPLPDGGACGPDDAFDVFVWPGAAATYVEGIGDEPATEWDDQRTILVVDPTTADELRAQVAHELGHACQAADSWSASYVISEMSSTYVERLAAVTSDPYDLVLADFQSHPEWSLDRNDGFETTYMYGAALYLDYLRDRYFGGESRFLSRIWVLSRRNPGTDEPDFEDAIDAILSSLAGITYLDSAVEFARWRWFTAGRDDGAHFRDGAGLPATAMVPAVDTVTTLPDEVAISVMALGSAYIDLTTAGPVDVVSVSADPGVTWAMQVVPGTEPGSDGETLDLSGGGARVDASADRTLIVTAVPHEADADPDLRRDDLYTHRLSFVAP